MVNNVCIFSIHRYDVLESQWSGLSWTCARQVPFWNILKIKQTKKTVNSSFYSFSSSFLCYQNGFFVNLYNVVLHISKVLQISCLEAYLWPTITLRSVWSIDHYGLSSKIPCLFSCYALSAGSNREREVSISICVPRNALFVTKSCQVLLFWCLLSHWDMQVISIFVTGSK